MPIGLAGDRVEIDEQARLKTLNLGLQNQVKDLQQALAKAKGKAKGKVARRPG